MKDFFEENKELLTKFAISCNDKNQLESISLNGQLVEFGPREISKMFCLILNKLNKLSKVEILYGGSNGKGRNLRWISDF